jgi:PIN domain nuclease of toxin-antitoxin system
MERPAHVNYLLDTSPWINGTLEPELLPARIRELLAGEETVGLPDVCLLEAAILDRRGRLELKKPLAEFYAQALGGNIRVLPITADIAAGTNRLPDGFQGDPFDRTITATAVALGLTLITADPLIRDAKVCAVEYYAFRPKKKPAT